MLQREHLKRMRLPSLYLVRRRDLGISTHLWPITLQGKPSTKVPSA